MYSNQINAYLIVKVATYMLFSLFDGQFIWWWFNCIMFIYSVCLIFIDITNAKEQPINALISIIILVLVIFSIFKMRSKWLSGNLFLQSSSQYNSIYSYLHILRNIWIVWLFWTSSLNNKSGIYITYLWIQVSISAVSVFLILNGITKHCLLMAIFEIWIIVWLPYFQLKLSMNGSSS